jgi:8-oxo-dGTP pyrophosphatase MutT (NUDIX family)
MKEIDKYLERTVFTPAVVGFLTDGERVCLGIRKKVSFGLGENLIAGVGGKVGDSPETKDETSYEATKREFLEEIGITVVKAKEIRKLRFIYPHKAPDTDWNQDVVVYLITSWEGDPIETQSTKPAWFDISNIPWESMWEDNKHWLPKVLSGQKVDAIFLFNENNKLSDFRFEKS